MACPFYWYNHHYACMKSEKDVNGISTEDTVVTTTMRTALFISMKNLPDVF